MQAQCRLEPVTELGAFLLFFRGRTVVPGLFLCRTIVHLVSCGKLSVLRNEAGGRWSVGSFYLELAGKEGRRAKKLCAHTPL